MAGLYTNIVTSKNRALPRFPDPDDTFNPYYSQSMSSTPGHHWFPGFANDANSKSSVMLDIWHLNNIEYNDEDGDLITDGVWATNLTPSEATGGNGDYFTGAYMDSADNLLYLVTVDNGTSPDTYYLSSVNKAGTVSQIGNAQIGNASMDGIGYNNNNKGALRRSGGDGSGDFILPFSGTYGGNAAAAAPYRGVNITFALADGSISYSSLFGSNYGSKDKPRISGCVGPTANNIYGGFVSGGLSGATYWGLWNVSTGDNVYQWINTSQTIGFDDAPIAFEWRGAYAFAGYQNVFGHTIYAKTDFDDYLDKLGEYNGLL